MVDPLAVNPAPPAGEDEPLACPLCEYDLRGLTDPRCPECGYAFEWADLRDPARRKHKYLFEHHPERNVGSFLRTLVGGLQPRRFWGGLLPSQPSRPRRLFVYALVIVVSATLPPAALVAHAAVINWTQMAARRAQMTAALAAPTNRTWYRIYGRPAATTQQVLDNFAPAPTVGRVLEYAINWRPLKRIATGHVMALLWPALTFAALMIFQISMHRARLRPVHFVRCVVYSADVILWASLLLAALVVAYVLRQILIAPARPPGDLHDFYVAAAPAAAAVLLVFVYRMIVALKKYLRFDHPISTILATQVITFLVAMILLVALTDPFGV